MFTKWFWLIWFAAGDMIEVMTKGYVDLSTVSTVPMDVYYGRDNHESGNHIIQKPSWVEINLCPRMDYSPFDVGEKIKFSQN